MPADLTRLPIRRAQARRWRWARHVERVGEHLRCPCCSLSFGADELRATSFHVVHGHPMPDNLDAAIEVSACTDAELDLLRRERVHRMSPQEREALRADAEMYEREARELREVLDV